MKKIVILLMLVLTMPTMAKDKVRDSKTTYAQEALQPFVDNGVLAGAVSIFYLTLAFEKSVDISMLAPLLFLGWTEIAGNFPTTL